MTTRTDLIAAIRSHLRLAAEMGCPADGEVPCSVVADYIIALAPHIAAGAVTFEGQEPPPIRPEFAAAIAELKLRRPPIETTIERPRGAGEEETDVMTWRVTV